MVQMERYLDIDKFQLSRNFPQWKLSFSTDVRLLTSYLYFRLNVFYFHHCEITDLFLHC